MEKHNQFETVPYLDKGYVRVVDWMGDDRLLAKTARTSFDADAYESDNKNKSLIDYLVEHRHTSPLEMGDIVFEIKMPIFVMRQHVRHRTASLSEVSLRYSEQSGDYYLPEVERFRYQDQWNKQGSGEPMPRHIAETCREMVQEVCEKEWDIYKKLIAAGVSKETARGVLNVQFYTKCVWKMNVHNLMHYLKLRNSGHAQWEIQVMAEGVESFFEKLFPMTYAAYTEYVAHAVTFSRSEMEMLKQIVSNSQFELADKINGSARRARDFYAKIGFEPEQKEDNNG
jgi:thymidylate synthase (FAD)